jgi:sugar fermentation stimulation protein A
MPGVKMVLPNTETHKEFGEALSRAVQAGVKVLYLQCEIGEDTMRIISA